jgi:GTP cyclohydrolase I
MTKKESAPLSEHVAQILKLLGEDPKREGLLKTPKRVEESLKFLTSGYHHSAEEVLNRAIFNESYDEMVLIRDIELYSLCEHHLLPFFGKCHVAYIPKGKVIGLSKVPRLVDLYAKRLQVQERLTTQIAECLMKHLEPKGVAVVIEASHLCMIMRGVQKQNSLCTTSAMLGVFRRDERTRREFLSLISRQKG